MKERPIIFSHGMIRAILNGRKTMTRRVVKSSMLQSCERDPLGGNIVYVPDRDKVLFNVQTDVDNFTTFNIECPCGVPGDRLWVKESFWRDPQRPDSFYKNNSPRFDADMDDMDIQVIRNWGWAHTSSIRMPRWASRIILEITNVNVERVQEISPPNCEQEGITGSSHATPVNGLPYETYTAPGLEDFKEVYPKLAYRRLWDDTAKPGYTWNDNPWVWVIEFKRVLSNDKRRATYQGG